MSALDELRLKRILDAVEGVQAIVPSTGTESELQQLVFDWLADAATGVGFSIEAEHNLSVGDRVDFLLDGRVAVELKVKGTRNEVARQLARYAAHPCIEALVLVTTRNRLRAMPTHINGKPLRTVVCLGGSL